MTKLIKRASAEARAFRNKAADGDDHTPNKQIVVRNKKRALHDDDLHDAPQIEAPRKPRFAPVTFSEEGGVRFLHFGTEWVQGAMRLRKPDHIELEYAQQMMAWLLFIETPRRIVQLGLGAAALTKFAHRFLKRAKVEAVEVNPAVVVAARTMFELPHDDARLTVHEMDAWDFVNDRANHGTIVARCPRAPPEYPGPRTRRPGQSPPTRAAPLHSSSHPAVQSGDPQSPAESQPTVRCSAVAGSAE